MWSSCAAVLDGWIYFIPRHARRIMKLNSNNNDAISRVGNDLGDGEVSALTDVCMGYRVFSSNTIQPRCRMNSWRGS